MSVATLDTTINGTTAAPIILTTQTLITLYAFFRTGAAGNYRLTIEVSPDGGVTWIDSDAILDKPGIVTISCVATNARVKVIVKEKTASTVIVHLIAR